MDTINIQMVRIYGSENVQSVKVEGQILEGDEKMQEYKKIKQFDPEGKHFLFNFTENECGEKATGICNLDSNDKEARCKKIINIIKEHPKVLEKYPITLFKYKCGHYDFNDGRHRTCAAIKLGIKIDVELIEDHGLCRECQPPQSDNHDVEIIVFTK